jgi:glycosyltransferase involved in cell wall biosynthesis
MTKKALGTFEIVRASEKDLPCVKDLWQEIFGDDEGFIDRFYSAFPVKDNTLVAKDGEKVVFNYIGRILHDKGVDDYIEAAKRIKAEYPNTEFNMLGFIEPTEMHYEAELSALEKEDIVKYRGSLKDIKSFVTA